MASPFLTLLVHVLDKSSIAITALLPRDQTISGCEIMFEKLRPIALAPPIARNTSPSMTLSSLLLMVVELLLFIPLLVDDNNDEDDAVLLPSFSSSRREIAYCCQKRQQSLTKNNNNCQFCKFVNADKLKVSMPIEPRFYFQQITWIGAALDVNLVARFQRRLQQSNNHNSKMHF